MKTLFHLLLAGLLLGAMACSSNDESQEATADAGAAMPEAQEMTVDPNAAYTPAAEGMTIAGITFYPHEGWTDLGPSGMRKAEYAFGPIGEEADSATMTVYYFGPDQGGGVDANLQRWIGQMTLAEGSEPKRLESTVEGMKAHMVEARGTYNVSSGMMMGGDTTLKEGYLMSAVVLETDQGNVFFKLTGPQQTAREMAGSFKKMLENIEKAG
jgi:hypothetical protein